MTDNLIYLLIFLPLAIPLLVILGFFPAKLIWWAHTGVCAFCLLGYIWLLSQFYLIQNFLAQGYVTQSIPWSTQWGINFQFRLDFLSISLALVFSITLICTALISKEELIKNSAKMGALSLLGGSAFAVTLSKEFPLSILFMGTLLLPELLLMGWDQSADRIRTLKKHVFHVGLSMGLFLICVLAFSEPFRGELARWFTFSGREYELRYKNFLFTLFCAGAMLRVGIFPLQSRLGCLFRLSSVECLPALLFGSELGFYLLFRYGPSFFPLELQRYASVFATIAMLQILYAVVYLGNNQGEREHIYGTKQFWGGILLLGFLSFGPMGWVGFWALLLMQILATALAIFATLAGERREKALKFSNLAQAPFWAGAKVLSTLCLLSVPLTSIFYSIVLVLWSASTKYRTEVIPILVVLPIFLWIGVRRLFFSHNSKDSADLTSSIRELGRIEIAVIFGVGTVILICGLYPDLLLAPLGVQIDQIWSFAHMGGS